MENANISEDLLDNAYKLLMLSMSKTDFEKATFETICAVCDKHNLSVRKYMAAVNELNDRLKELENNDANY